MLVILPFSIASSQESLKLSELQLLKADNFKLRVQVEQLKAQLLDREAKLKSIELTNEQAKLVEEFRIELKADPTDVFDWNTLTFNRAKPDSN